MNSSDRILKVIKLCESTGVRETHSALNGWRKALRQPWDNQDEISDSALLNRFTAVNDQINDLESALLSKNIPQYLFSEHLPHLRQAFSPLATSSQWGSVTKLLSPQLKVALQWSSWAIGETEKAISKDDLQELMSSLNELDALIAEPGLPDLLRGLIQKNVREIREAVELYPIIGADGLKVAVSNFFGEAFTQQDTLRAANESHDPSTKETLGKFLQVIKGAVDAVNTSVTTHESLIKIGALAATLKLPLLA